MKSFILFLGAVLALNLSAQAAPVNDVVETKFWVSGDCNGCKMRIEKAMDVKGVKYASYDLKTNMLTVTYNSKHITEDKIHTLLHDVGHQTKKAASCADGKSAECGAKGENGDACCSDKSKSKGKKDSKDAKAKSAGKK